MVKAKARVTIYTDGACRGNPGPGGWGALMLFGKKRKELFGGDPQTTNNRMELSAVIHSLESLKNSCAVEIWTDSKYVMDGVQSWMKGWKARGWLTSSRKPVKNRDLWERLDKAMLPHQLDWHWVKGHSGHPGNERADELANRGIDEGGIDEGGIDEGPAHRDKLMLLVPTLFELEMLPDHPSREELREGSADWRGFQVMLCGMGPVDAACAAARAFVMGQEGPALLCGLAGTYSRKKAPLTSLVSITDFVMEGLGVIDENGVRSPEELDLPDSVRGQLPFESRERATFAIPKLPELAALTVASSSASAGIATSRKTKHKGVVVEEMEGFAVARAARLASRSFACIRAIANEAGERDKRKWKARVAMEVLADYLSELGGA